MQVIELLEKEGVEWSEENRGTVLIKLDGQREFSFLDSESDTEWLFSNVVACKFVGEFEKLHSLDE